MDDLHDLMRWADDGGPTHHDDHEHDMLVYDRWNHPGGTVTDLCPVDEPQGKTITSMQKARPRVAECLAKFAVAFRARCESVAEKVGVNVYFHADAKKQNPYVDDGFLHIAQNGVRACFFVQNDDPTIQNKFLCAVCKEMHVDVTDDMLADECREQLEGFDCSADFCGGMS